MNLFNTFFYKKSLYNLKKLKFNVFHLKQFAKKLSEGRRLHDTNLSYYRFSSTGDSFCVFRKVWNIGHIWYHLRSDFGNISDFNQVYKKTNRFVKIYLFFFLFDKILITFIRIFINQRSANYDPKSKILLLTLFFLAKTVLFLN